MANAPIDVGYARALFEMARAEDVVDRVEDDLHRLRNLLVSRGELLDFLKDPGVRHEGKRRGLAELFEGRLHTLVLNMLITISDQDRGRRLLSIIERYRAIAASARARLSGEVITAMPLDEATVERMAEKMSRITGKSVRLLQKVDRSLLGGAVIRVGEQVIDGSLRRKLRQVEEHMARY